MSREDERRYQGSRLSAIAQRPRMDLDQVIQLDPRNAMAYANRCAAHFNKGETDLALSDCDQAIQLDPKNAMAYANRCAAHFNKGETRPISAFQGTRR